METRCSTFLAIFDRMWRQITGDDGNTKNPWKIRESSAPPVSNIRGSTVHEVTASTLLHRSSPLAAFLKFTFSSIYLYSSVLSCRYFARSKLLKTGLFSRNLALKVSIKRYLPASPERNIAATVTTATRNELSMSRRRPTHLSDVQ